MKTLKDKIEHYVKNAGSISAVIFVATETPAQKVRMSKKIEQSLMSLYYRLRDADRAKRSKK